MNVARMTGVNIPSRVVPTGHGRHKWRPYDSRRQAVVPLYGHAAPPCPQATEPKVIARQREAGTHKGGHKREQARDGAAPRAHVERVDPTAHLARRGGVGIGREPGDAPCGGVEVVAVGCAAVAQAAVGHGGRRRADGDALMPHAAGGEGVVGRLPRGGRPAASRRPAVGTAFYFAFLIPFSFTVRRRRAVSPTLRHLDTEDGIESRTIPRERPRQPRQGHQQEESQGIHTPGHVQVAPETAPPPPGGEREAAAQGTPGARPPEGNTRQERGDKEQRRDAHQLFAPEHAVAGRPAVEQPAVQAEHGREERRPLIAPNDFAGVGIDGSPSMLRAGEIDAPRAPGVGLDGDAGDAGALGQGGSHTAGGFVEGHDGSPDRFGMEKLTVAQANHLVLEHEHRPRETDKRDDHAERHGEPKVELSEKFSHKG